MGLGLPPPPAAELAAITAISAAAAIAKIIRLMMRYLLVRATLGGLLLNRHYKKRPLSWHLEAPPVGEYERPPARRTWTLLNRVGKLTKLSEQGAEPCPIHHASSTPSGTSSSELLPEKKVEHRSDATTLDIPTGSVFDKLVQVLVFGCAYEDRSESCSATTLRRRRDRVDHLFRSDGRLQQICSTPMTG